MSACMKAMLVNNFKSPRRVCIIMTVVCVLLTWVFYYYDISSWIWKNRILPDTFCRKDQINFTKFIQTPVHFQHMGDFQMISPYPNKMYFYSAYFDEEMNAVKLLGGVKDGTDTKVYCHFYNKQNVLYWVRFGNIYHFEDNWSNKPYLGSFVICPLTPPACEPPAYVSLSAGEANLEAPSNLFQVQYSPSLTNNEFVGEEYDFALCVPPSFTYENPVHFLEWYEFYKLIGVQKFTFYNESIGPRTSCLMKQLEAEGQVEILKWSPGFESGVDTFYHSQMIQTVDCVLRYRGHAKYVIGVDLDEFIMPSISTNYRDLLHDLVQNYGLALDATSAIVFRNAMFYASTPNESTKNATILEQLNMVKYKWRSKDLNPLHQRSKYFGIPNRISVPGVHYVYRAVGSSKMFDVPVETAYLHHYRFNFSDTGCADASTCKTVVEDPSYGRFVDQVAAGVELKIRKYGSPCNIVV